MATKMLYGVPIYTMDKKRSIQESIVIGDSEIKFSGDAEVAVRLYPRAERINLQHGCVIPGFIDSHIHFKDFSLLFKDIDLTDMRASEDIIEKVKAAVSKKKENKWIKGGGADFSILEKMAKSDLDAVSTQNPLVLFSRDMHSVLINSAALLAAGINASRPDPLGGKIERNDNGSPTGILRERAVELVKHVIPEETTTQVDVALEKGMKKLLANGITGFCDCSVYSTGSLIGSIMKIWRRGKMNIRAVLMFGDREASRLGNIGIPSLFGNEKVMIGGCKVIMDGFLSSMTGYMSRPYRGRETSGMLLMDEKELYEVLKRSYSHYIWAAVHAIGDKANELALNVFERLSSERGVPNLLKRIEHAQSLKDEDIERFSTIGVIPVVNPVHIPVDRILALKYLGPDARLLHRLGSLLSSGAALTLASDAPAGPVSPFRGIYAAVERKDFDEGPELRFFPKERISLIDAVYAYTMGGARAVGLEEKLGSIETGKYADLIHISEDIFARGTGILKDVEVLRTFVRGKIVYERS